MAREEVGDRPDLVQVELERATADQDLSDYSADFFHPSDAGYSRYVTAFREAVEAADPQPSVPEPVGVGTP